MEADLANMLQALMAADVDQGIKEHAQRILTLAPADDALSWALLELVQQLAAQADVTTAQQVLTHLWRTSSDFDYEKALATHAVAEHYFAAGQQETATAWTQRAVQWAEGIQEPWRQAEVLNRIATMLWAAHERSTADELWQRAIAAAQAGEAGADPQARIDSASVLWEIVQDLHRSGAHAYARATAHTIQNLGKRQRALASIAS
jgi:hypothetical protein